MATIFETKELECAATPLLLFRCTLVTGDVHLWSTHGVSVGGETYEARVLQHNAFEIRSSADDATDGAAKLSLTLANADGYYTPIERIAGWKGAQIAVTFLFYDYDNDAASDSHVVFRGIANAPEESSDSGLKLTFTNRLNLTRTYLPETAVQKLCPWAFPATAEQRMEALTGNALGKFSPMYRCGYSAGVEGGCGDLNDGAPFVSCDGSRASCEERGMFSKDAIGNTTARFGGIEFVPPSLIVRTYRDKRTHVSSSVENQAAYNDSVPLVYGTGWYDPLIVFARNDGNLTHMEVLLGAGEIDSVLKVVVNDIEIPAGVSGANMTATGWYNVTSYGARNGAFNNDFSDASGAALGDPYGSLAYMSVVVPNAISNGRSLPSIHALVRGLKLTRYAADGTTIGEAYTNNPAWVMLDVMQRGGWTMAEIDAASFAAAAAVCETPITTVDSNGNSVLAPRFQCNLILTRTRSAADIVRGIRNGSGLFLSYNPEGLLRVNVEDTIAGQQANKPQGSNAAGPLNGGWPAYEFGDNALSGIVLKPNGQSSMRVYSRNTADTPNRFSIEFQDEFNSYQQDSFTIIDAEDRLNVRQVISAPLMALGIPNYDQAARIAYLALSKSIRGNTYIEFETSVKSINLAPGDIITLTYAREGFERQPFRMTRIAPGMNYRRALITAQIHDDEWYSASDALAVGVGRQGPAHVGAPRPLIGSLQNADGTTDFAVSEAVTADTDGTSSVALSASFKVPPKPSSSAATIPLVSMQPLYASTGGALEGAATYYYAVSALDNAGNEGQLSLTVAAVIPAGTNSNCVTLQNLSFSRNTTSFDVYRGRTPAGLLRIASAIPIAAQFTDDGSAAELEGPPDPNFDHANFYWRFVLRPGEKADVFSGNTIGSSSAGMQSDEYRGAIARISKGTGAGQERTIISNSDTTLAVARKWDIQPDATSEFLIADASWRFGATSMSSPATLNVPNQAGAVVQISGRAANVHDDECAYELSPVTTWKIGGGSGAAFSLDKDVPAQPTFGLSAAGQGTIEVVGIGFADLTNTRGISSGTLSLIYWDEVAGASPIPLGTAVSERDSMIALNGSLNVSAGELFQMESELVMALHDVSNATSLVVGRGQYGTTSATHEAGVSLYPLARKTFVMPFPHDFFGTPSSGSYCYRMLIPDVRVAAADFYVTNSCGNSSVAQSAFTSTQDAGIRTLSGGQASLQVDGPLAIQTNASPWLLMDESHAVRDIFAVVGTAPVGGSLEVHLTQNEQVYCTLAIADGCIDSNVVNGATLPPLRARDRIGLDITSAPQTPDSIAGADLTVTIRL